MPKKAFTLVELIVVITILAVLATVAFISFQWYALSARDSTRLADLNSITKVLELYNVKHWKYPNPDAQTNITYSWSTAWTQWVFGISSYSDWSSMSNIPVDPVTGLEYPYSVTSSRQEYQLAAVLENPTSSKLSQLTFAWTQEVQVHVKWNYNGKFLKVRKEATTFLLWVPSILASDITSVELETILANERLVYKGYKNLPASYSWSVYNTNPTDGFNFWDTDSILLFEGNISDISNSDNDTLRVNIIKNIQKTYSWSIIANNNDIKPLLAKATTIITDDLVIFANTLINNTLKTNIPIDYSHYNTQKIHNPEYFVSTWNVWIDTGLTWFGKLKLPLQSDGIYNFNINWWDGTTDNITSYNQSEVTHVYPSDGIYEVIIDWTIDWFGFNTWWNIDNLDDGDKMVDIRQWGSLLLANKRMNFKHCDNLLTFSAIDAPNLSNITTIADMFYNAPKFSANLNHWDTSNITNMTSVFHGASNFNWDISSWDTSNVTSMSYMFNWAANFNQDISSWDVTNVINMDSMFANANKFNSQLRDWDVSSVTNMKMMFYRAYDFTSDLSSWNVSQVINMLSLFNSAHNFTSDLNDWDIWNITGSNLANIFAQAHNFNSDLNNWNTGNLTSLYWVFYQNNKFNWNISTWDTSNVTNIWRMFRWATIFNQDISNWDVSNVTNMTETFDSAKEFNQNLSNWNVNNVTSMNRLFSGADNFTSDLSWWNVSSVTDMNNLFNSVDNFTSDLSWWNVSNVTNMHGLFVENWLFTSDLSSWDVSNVTDMSAIFRNANSFNSDLSSWDVSNVIDMRYMFGPSNSFVSDLSLWDVSNVTAYSSFGCSNCVIPNWN